MELIFMHEVGPVPCAHKALFSSISLPSFFVNKLPLNFKNFQHFKMFQALFTPFQCFDNIKNNNLFRWITISVIAVIQLENYRNPA